VAGPQRLDLRSGQCDAGLDTLLDGVVEGGLAIVGELQIARLLLGRGDRRRSAVRDVESVQRAKRDSGGISAAAVTGSPKTAG